MNKCKSPTTESSPAKPMNCDGSAFDCTQSEWQQVDLLEFLATTIDLRIVLFQAEEPSILRQLTLLSADQTL
jgi:hypothetical protein